MLIESLINKVQCDISNNMGMLNRIESFRILKILSANENTSLINDELIYWVYHKIDKLYTARSFSIEEWDIISLFSDAYIPQYIHSQYLSLTT